MVDCSVCDGRGLLHASGKTEKHKRCAECVVCERCNGTGREGGRGKLDDPKGKDQVKGALAACAVQ